MVAEVRVADPGGSRMAADLLSFIGGRNYERVLIILLLAIVAAVLLDKARDIRGQAELGAFQYNLGALRVALALEQVHGAAMGKKTRAAQVNPFMNLNKPLRNYAGEIPLLEALAGAVPPGTWFFDGLCPCIGYRPFDDRRFTAPSNSNLMVFDLLAGDLPATPSPVLLPVREPYLWWGTQIR